MKLAASTATVASGSSSITSSPSARAARIQRATSSFAAKPAIGARETKPDPDGALDLRFIVRLPRVPGQAGATIARLPTPRPEGPPPAVRPGRVSRPIKSPSIQATRECDVAGVGCRSASSGALAASRGSIPTGPRSLRRTSASTTVGLPDASVEDLPGRPCRRGRGVRALPLYLWSHVGTGEPHLCHA
jgi:hypothetical protein